MNRLLIVLVCLLSFFSIQPQAFAESSDALCTPPSDDIDPVQYQQFLADLGDVGGGSACFPVAECVKTCLYIGFAGWVAYQTCYAFESGKCVGIKDPDERDECEWRAERACGRTSLILFTSACLGLCVAPYVQPRHD